MRIKPPPKDASTGKFKSTTVALVEYRYDKRKARSAVRYLGAFNLGMDPDSLDEERSYSSTEQLPKGLHLGGKAADAGRKSVRGSAWTAEELELPVVLDKWHVRSVKNWLRAYGTYRDPNKPSERVIAELREKFWRELQLLWTGQKLDRPQLADAERVAALKASAVAHVRAVLEHEHSQRSALLELPGLLRQAGAELVEQAQRLRQDRYRLASQDSASEDVDQAGPLDRLQAQANQVRGSAMAQFEAACRRARLGSRSVKG